jgi:two-component system, cell cycle sensor histidine kinase and response regulator CckA
VSNFDQFPLIEILTLKLREVPMCSPTDLKPQSKMVLCIDDDQEMLECEKAFLESFGYTVLIAANCDKGVELAATHAIDIVIVDYFMPGMNGHQAAAEMKRLRPQAPIVMLSGAVELPEQVLQCVDAFIAKNQLATQLLPVIARLEDGCSTAKGVHI